jgi:ATP-binding cassette subfamily B protein
MLGLGAIVFLITYFVRKISYKLYDKTRKAISLVNSGVIESKNNFLFIKADNGEDFIKKANDKNLQVFKKHALKQRYFNTTISQFTSFTFTIFNILTILWCVLLILKGSPNMSIGLLVAMIQLVIQIKAPLVNMSSYITVYQETAVSMDRVNELIFDSESEKQKLDGKDFERLEIKELSFSYDNHKVLDSVNLTINKGDKVLIKGISGEGKSTLLKILLGVLKQNGGEVKGVYNGVSYDLYSLNGTCRLVPQGNMLFSGTIKENLLFNNDTATQSEIDEVLKLTCLKDFVNSLEFGIETKLTENSSTISEGQAQRIAIARALLKKAPVLILDEATSSLDEKTEKEIISNLQKIENLTLIAVSHKDAIKDICNKHFEIANGKLNLLN